MNYLVDTVKFSFVGRLLLTAATLLRKKKKKSYSGFFSSAETVMLMMPEDPSEAALLTDFVGEIGRNHNLTILIREGIDFSYSGNMIRYSKGDESIVGFAGEKFLNSVKDKSFTLFIDLSRSMNPFFLSIVFKLSGVRSIGRSFINGISFYDLEFVPLGSNEGAEYYKNLLDFLLMF